MNGTIRAGVSPCVMSWPPFRRRAATTGAIELLLVDIDEVRPGRFDDAAGSFEIAAVSDGSSYDLPDEIAGRAMLTGAKVLVVCTKDIPYRAPTAATFRYPV